MFGRRGTSVAMAAALAVASLLVAPAPALAASSIIITPGPWMQRFYDPGVPAYGPHEIDLGSFTDSLGDDAGPWTVTVYYCGSAGGGTETYTVASQGELAVSHVFSHGDCEVEFHVQNAVDPGNWQFARVWVYVNPSPPAVVLAPPSDPVVVHEGTPVSFQAGFMEYWFTGPWTIHLDYGDGTSSETTVSVEDPFTVSHLYPARFSGEVEREYTLTMTVTDDLGISGSASVRVHVLDDAPVLTTVPVVTIPPTATEVTLGSFTDTSEGPWAINVQQGSGGWWTSVDAPGPITIPVSSLGDSRTLTLTVVDMGGLSDSAEVTVDISGTAPVVGPIGSWGGGEGEGLGVYATFTDPDLAAGETYVCRVDFGDGTGWEAGQIGQPYGEPPYCSAWHFYSVLGMHTVTVEVTGSLGDTGAATLDVDLPNQAPALQDLILVPQTPENRDVLIFANFTDPGQSNPYGATPETYTCTLDYGDGTGPEAGRIWAPDQCQGPSHHYAADGTYTATMTVTDGNGGSDSKSMQIVVANIPPRANGISPIGPAGVGAVSSVTAWFIHPEGAYSATIDWGDGIVETRSEFGSDPQVSAGHAYSRAGLFTVTVTVSDGLASATQKAEAVVYSPARKVVGSGAVYSRSWACTRTSDCRVASAARFSLKAGHATGATEPSVSFRFSAARFDLVSTSAEWLVVGSRTAILQGTATVNRYSTGHTYRLTVSDRGLPGSRDGLRLQVWNSAGVLVYDNRSVTALSSGYITIS